MRAKKKQPENPEKSIANTMGNAVNAVKKLSLIHISEPTRH